MKNILVIGAGAMGAAFTIPCSDNKHKVTLFLFSKHGMVKAAPIAPAPMINIFFIIKLEFFLSPVAILSIA